MALTPRPRSSKISSPTGVIDPAKVTRSALQNAASIAGLMLTTEAMIAEAPGRKGRRRRRCPAAWAAWEWECSLILDLGFWILIIRSRIHISRQKASSSGEAFY